MVAVAVVQVNLGVRRRGGRAGEEMEKYSDWGGYERWGESRTS